MPEEKEHTLIIWIALMVTLLLVLLWAVQPVSTVEAGAGLPNRDTPTPKTSSDDSDDDKDDKPIGASIELHVQNLQVQNATAGVWSVIQWQDSAGNWHNVDGWQGTLDANGFRYWWVAQKDFGTGPFRWLVTQSQDGPMLGKSAPFNLPLKANEIKQIKVLL